MKVETRAKEDIQREKIGRIIQELVWYARSWKPKEMGENLCVGYFYEDEMIIHDGVGSITPTDLQEMIAELKVPANSN